MAVKRMELRPKRVKRLRIKPVRKVNAFDAYDLVREAKQLHDPANDESIEIQMLATGLTMQLRPISALSAQIRYLPDGPLFEEEIHVFLWKCEKDTGWIFWNADFSAEVLEAWKDITKELN